MYPKTDNMPVPPGFRYADIFKKGRPRHGTAGQPATYDAFFAKHPPMESSRRAKIFAPFDALCGFDEAVAAKRVCYEDRRELTEAEREELDRELDALQKLSSRRRHAGEKPVSLCVTFFQPCGDPESEAFGKKGTYKTVTGKLEKADSLCRRLILDSGCVIPMDDVIRVSHSLEIPEQDRMEETV